MKARNSTFRNTGLNSETPRSGRGEAKLLPAERMAILRRFLGASSVAEMLLDLKAKEAGPFSKLIGNHTIRIHVPLPSNPNCLMFESKKYDEELRTPRVLFCHSSAALDSSGRILFGSIEGFAHQSCRDVILFADKGMQHKRAIYQEDEWTDQARSYFDAFIRMIDVHAIRSNQPSLWPPFMDLQEWLRCARELPIRSMSPELG